jgi:hypothetical protein
MEYLQKSIHYFHLHKTYVPSIYIPTHLHYCRYLMTHGNTVVPRNHAMQEFKRFSTNRNSTRIKRCSCDSNTAIQMQVKSHRMQRPGLRLHGHRDGWMVSPWVQIPLKACMFVSSINHHSLVTLSSMLHSLVTEKVS